MLIMTRSAGACLSEMLEDSPTTSVVRIVPKGTSSRMRICRDFIRSGDVRFAHEGKTVLVLDKNVAQTLTKRTLGTHETDEGLRLCLKRLSIST